MKKIIFALLLVVLFASCVLSFSDDEVKIRIENNSEFAMDSVLAIYPEDEILYGLIPAGEASTYQTVTKAYRYAYIETKINGELSVIQPIDYVGESLLKTGRYTYVLSVLEENEGTNEPHYNLTLELEKD